MKFTLPLAAAAALGAATAAVVRSRRDVEVWHVAPDPNPGDVSEIPEGP
ncbi:hypothetical protein [Mycobacterium asiaticum]|nr:hypothetical protein [Mycobacterium asiaticum]